MSTGLVLVARHRSSDRGRRVLRVATAAVVMSSILLVLRNAAAESPLTIWDLLPLQLCDLLLLVALWALLARHRLASELLYFWAGAGTVLALATPDLQVGFPSAAFFCFFGLHGLVIASAALLTFGCDVRPRPGAVWRVFGLTNAYAAAVALVNAIWGTNYLYLRAKPGVPTLLDWMGPWPVYVLSADVLALLLFFVLDLPFRTSRRVSLLGC